MRAAGDACREVPEHVEQSRKALSRNGRPRFPMGHPNLGNTMYQATLL